MLKMQHTFIALELNIIQKKLENSLEKKYNNKYLQSTSTQFNNV